MQLLLPFDDNCLLCNILTRHYVKSTLQECITHVISHWVFGGVSLPSTCDTHTAFCLNGLSLFHRVFY